MDDDRRQMDTSLTMVGPMIPLAASASGVDKERPNSMGLFQR
jgi:hypothetical protein